MHIQCLGPAFVKVLEKRCSQSFAALPAMPLLRPALKRRSLAVDNTLDSKQPGVPGEAPHG